MRSITCPSCGKRVQVPPDRAARARDARRASTPARRAYLALAARARRAGLSVPDYVARIDAGGDDDAARALVRAWRGH